MKMKMKHASRFDLILILGLLFTVNLGQIACRGKQFEKWEAQNENNKIVVTAYREQYRFNPGAYYEFEFLGGGEKLIIMTFRHDDPVPIDKRGVVFLNAQIMYVYMGWKYAVTTDGGETWDTWNAQYDLRDWKCCNYYLINTVTLDKNGSGKMRLSKSKDMAAKTLVTSDYGKTWVYDDNRRISEN